MFLRTFVAVFGAVFMCTEFLLLPVMVIGMSFSTRPIAHTELLVWIGTFFAFALAWAYVEVITVKTEVENDEEKIKEFGILIKTSQNFMLYGNPVGWLLLFISCCGLLGYLFVCAVRGMDPPNEHANGD